MRSRVPVLAAVTAVAVLETVVGRDRRTASDRPDRPSAPPLRVAPPPPSTETGGRPARRRWRLAGAAGLVATAALGLALPSALPSSAASAGAPLTVAAPPDARNPQERYPLEADRQRLAAERRDAAQVQVSRSRRGTDQQPGASSTGGTGSGGTPADAPPLSPPAAGGPGPTAGTGPAPGPAAPTTVSPVAAPVGSEYGYRWGRLHAGLDFPAPHGTPVLAVADGTVEQAGPAGGYGKLVTIRHGDGTVTAYGHMRVLAVTPGEAVRAGQLIAEVGSEGRSTGPHLHFEVRTPEGKRDPRPWLAERGVAL